MTHTETDYDTLCRFGCFSKGMHGHWCRMTCFRLLRLLRSATATSNLATAPTSCWRLCCKKVAAAAATARAAAARAAWEAAAAAAAASGTSVTIGHSQVTSQVYCRCCLRSCGSLIPLPQTPFVSLSLLLLPLLICCCWCCCCLPKVASGHTCACTNCFTLWCVNACITFLCHFVAFRLCHLTYCATSSRLNFNRQAWQWQCLTDCQLTSLEPSCVTI